MPRPQSILILGGTGFIGAQQVGYALARGHRVTLFNRGTHAAMWPPEVELLKGDREADDYAALAGREFDVCIDNKASVPRWVRGAARALEDRVGQYVLISTVSVYADNAAPQQDETAVRETYSGDDAFAISSAQLRANMAIYGAMKALCEDEVLKHYPDRAPRLNRRAGRRIGPVHLLASAHRTRWRCAHATGARSRSIHRCTRSRAVDDSLSRNA